jgi:hypothetical protein
LENWGALMKEIRTSNSIKAELGGGKLWGKRDMSKPFRSLEAGGGDPTSKIRSLYADNSVFPDGRPHERAYGPSNKHGDVAAGWMRGSGGDVTSTRPFFDQSKRKGSR